VAFAPAGGALASGGQDKVVRLWDPDTGQPAGALAAHAGAVTAVAFSPDGRWLATAGYDKTVRLWHAAGIAGHR
jgi:WD40 repeat protein